MIDMTLKKKILVGYGIVFILMGLVIAWSVVNLVSLGNASEAILSENYRSIRAAENMVNALQRQDNGILLIYLGEPGKGADLFRENEAIFFEWLTRAKDNITIEGEADLVKAIETDYMAYRRFFFEWADSQYSDAQPFSFASYDKTIYPLFAKVQSECVSLRQLNEGTMYVASAKARIVAKRAIWSTSFAAGSALIVALIFSLFLVERLLRPIRSFMEASKKISAGDYAIQVPVETGDEFGRLAQEFNEMAAKLLRYHIMNIDQIVSEKNKGEAILSSIEDGLIVFDTDLKATSINPAAREIFGIMLSETTSLRCSDIILDSRVCKLVYETVENGVSPTIPDEQRIFALIAGKQRRHYLFSITAVRGRDLRLSGIVLLLRNVTRLKEVEQLKSEFVLAASHELRTPLTSIGMSIDLLLEHASPALEGKDQELLKAAHEEVHRMKALINDLLDLSKIEAGRIEMEYDNIHIVTLFDHVRTLFKSQLDIKQIELKTEIPDKLPSVRVDENKITWVLTNLVYNALRYVGNGGHIHLMAYRFGPNVHISVQDDGPGIPLEYQSKIFQKFVQVKGRKTGGTGLGLAICKGIIRAHGGAIWVESPEGGGSTFIFTLPIKV
jgi:NtrC-family two-component system sensor histidine kinase KinB